MKKVVYVISFVLLTILLCSIFIVPKINMNKSNNGNTSSSVNFSELKYLAFGDSITAGSGLESQTLSYPNAVADILGCSIKNKGVGGSTLGFDSSDLTRHCIANDIVEFSKYSSSYNIVSVTGGSNDKGRSIPLGSINDFNTSSVYGSLNVIAETLISAYPNAFIFFMTPIKNPTCENLNSANYTLLNVANAIKEVANKYNIPVLDLYNTSQFENVDCGMNNADCDGWHPLKEFVSDYMAPQISQFIKDNYNK